MTPDRYSRRVRVTGTRGWVARAAIASAVLATAACSGDDDGTAGTLGVAPTGPTAAGSVAPGGAAATTSPGSAAGGAPGSGFVAIDVRLTPAGIAETISLDRSTVAATALDPVTLNATCTPLDGGDPAAGVVVSVVDLGRLAASQVVSAILRYADPAPGEHEMTLELGRADQSTSSSTGTVTVGADGMSGSFSGADSGGTAVTGGFTCATAATAVTTTTVALDAGEVVPEDSSAQLPVVTVPAVTVPGG